jgi:phosphoglycolate phosphatase
MLDLSAVLGPPMDTVMRGLLEPYGDDRVAEAVAAYRADYDQNCLSECAPYSGIAQALGEMRQSGAELYLATSKRRSFALRIIEHLGFSDLFNGIYGSEAGGILDSKPELIAHIVKRHALAQTHCVMVGDRQYDITGAHANGMRALGVLWGYGTRDELEAAGADDLVSNPETLPAAVFAMITADGE